MNMAESKVKTGYSLGPHKAEPGDHTSFHTSSLTQLLKLIEYIVDLKGICLLGKLFWI